MEENSELDQTFETSWTLWFHKVDDSDYSLNSYKKLYESWKQSYTTNSNNITHVKHYTKHIKTLQVLNDILNEYHEK